MLSCTLYCSCKACFQLLQPDGEQSRLDAPQVHPVWAYTGPVCIGVSCFVVWCVKSRRRRRFATPHIWPTACSYVARHCWRRILRNTSGRRQTARTHLGLFAATCGCVQLCRTVCAAPPLTCAVDKAYAAALRGWGRYDLPSSSVKFTVYVWCFTVCVSRVGLWRKAVTAFVLHACAWSCRA
jgi:hypothetical protein